MVSHIWNPSSPKIEARRSLSSRPGWSLERVQGQPILGSEGNHWKQKAGENVFGQRPCSNPNKQQNLATLATCFWLLNYGYKKGVRESPSMTKESCWGQAYVKGVHEWRPKEAVYEAVKVKHGLPWRPKMSEMPESWDTCQGKLLTGSGTSPGERSLLQLEPKGVRDLKSTLTSDMEFA